MSNSSLCPDCHCRQKVPGKYNCESCSNRKRVDDKRRRDKRRVDGTCGCGATAIPGTYRCQHCSKQNSTRCAKRRQNLSKLGLCNRCGKPKLPTIAICFDCWLTQMASSKYHKCDKSILEKLWIDQNGICPYLGEKLYPGETASLDHITPRDSGGSSNKLNLQWVHKKVNTAKSNLSHSEFISLCKQVVAYSEA
jgi:hypothetical protein